MIIPKLQIDVYPFISEGEWSDIPLTLDFPFEANEDEGIELRKDTFSFRLSNERMLGTNVFSRDIGAKDNLAKSFRMKDKILMYAWNGTRPTDMSDALIIDGTVNSVDYKGESNNLITIKGANATEMLLNTMVPTSIQDSDSLNVPNGIIEILNRANSFSKGRLKIAAWLNTEKRAWNDVSETFEIDNTNGVLGSIQALKGDGATSFPNIVYASNWKSAYQQIETLSTNEYTKDEGVYIFGIKPFKDPVSGKRFNQFFWNNKTISTLRTLTEGIDLLTTSIRRGTWDVYNAVIVNAGEDLYGAGILRIAYNAKSMGKIGAKWKYLPITDKFQRTYDADYQRGIELGSAFGDDRFPDTYDWVFDFESRDATTGERSGNAAVATDDTEYNNALRSEAGWQAAGEGQEIVENFGEARYKAEFELPVGSNNLSIGGLYELNSPSYGWEGTVSNPTKRLRLIDIKHTFNNNGWGTMIYFDEDEKVISDKVNT